jgi:hypothetical protein
MNKKNQEESDTVLVLDLENIFKWICSNDGSADTQITENYQTDETQNMQLIERQVNEVKNRSDSTIPTIKYDFIKLCISELETPIYNQEAKTMASFLIQNTLIYNKMIKEVKLEK